MVIKPLLIGALETALNSYLALDNNKRQFLAPLEGKVIAVTVQPFNETVYLCPASDSIQLLDYYPDNPDTRITGSLWSLGFMGISGKPMRSIFSGAVKIEGDIHAGRKFQELFDKLDIDLERKLSQVTGDNVARSIAGLFRSGLTWSRESIETFKLNLTEFLQDETKDLPAVPEADIFFSQVDELRTDYDRLQSRIERLAKITKSAKTESEI